MRQNSSRKNKPNQTPPEQRSLADRPLPHFDRIYFDTEPLLAAGWPRLSVALENVAPLAKGLHISLHVPEIAYSELEVQCLTKYNDEFDGAVNRTSKLRYRLEMLGGGSHVPEVPDVREEMRNRYLAIVESLKLTFLPTPTPALEIDDLVGQANAYELAFEAGDKGFKDTVIFRSVVEEVKGCQRPISAVFVSNDNVFREKREHLESWAKLQGASIHCTTLEEVAQALESRQSTEKQQRIEEDRKGAVACLRPHLSEVQSWLDQKVESFNWQTWPFFYPGPLLVYRAEIQRLASVTLQYSAHRHNGERITLTFDVETQLRASNITSAMRGGIEPQLILESSKITGAPHIRRYGSSPDVPVGSPAPIMQVSQGLIEIEAQATFDNGTYRDFKFLTARLKRVMPFQMPPAMPPPKQPPW